VKLHYLRLATFGEAICHHSATILTPETSTKAHQVLLLRNLDEIYAWELISHPSIVTLRAIFHQQDDVVNNIPLVSNASKRKYALSTFKDRWLYVLRRNSTRYKSQDLGAWALAAGRDSKCFETWLIEGITNLPRAADRWRCHYNTNLWKTKDHFIRGAQQEARASKQLYPPGFMLDFASDFGSK